MLVSMFTLFILHNSAPYTLTAFWVEKELSSFEQQQLCANCTSTYGFLFDAMCRELYWFLWYQGNEL